MKDKFYIISTKYTYPESACFTLWGSNGSGYCWYETWAGVYGNDKLEEYSNREDAGIFIVPFKKVRDLFEGAIYDYKIVSLLPNTTEIRKKIGIRKSELKGGMSKMTNNDLIWMKDLRPIGRRDQ